MATIKEMAIEAYPIIENGAFKQSQMEYEVETKQKRGAYFNGANAVLEIFKEIIENRNFCAFPKAIHQELLDKIKELKGE